MTNGTRGSASEADRMKCIANELHSARAVLAAIERRGIGGDGRPPVIGS
jgi:hypothetical protein